MIKAGPTNRCEGKGPSSFRQRVAVTVMTNLSVALVNDDYVQHVFHLLRVLILLTKLPTTTNRLHPAPHAMFYCLKGLLSLKVSHHIPYLTTP